MALDAETWKRHYPSTTVQSVTTADELFRILDQRYDVVHLFCTTDVNGLLAGPNVQGTELIARCFAAGVKLLWIAGDNDPQGYIRGFNPKGKQINLVMTINRNGALFSIFLDRLLAKLSSGQPMPTAWNDLCPQIPGGDHSEAPACIFAAGRGGVLLR
jgi:hypothetical protein